MNNEILQGEVVYVRKDEYLVDVGTGADVSLPYDEAITTHEVGDTIEIIVIDKVKGEKIVSEKRLGNLKKRQQLEELIGSEEVIQGKIVGYKNGQFKVEIDKNLFGQCYIKNLEIFFIDNGEEYIGKTYDFHVIGKNYGKFELSREKLNKSILDEKIAEFNKIFIVGSILRGNVIKHNKSGIIVNVGEQQVFIPKSEISYKLNSTLPEIGCAVDFEVIRTEPNRFNAVGSIKNNLIDPWTQINEFNTSDRYEGKISRIEEYGVFVELGEELQGLIHISELSHDFIEDTSIYSIGDTQEFKILEINNEDKNVKLSTKALYPSKYALAKEQFNLGQHLTLTVSKFYRSGIFVQLMNNYDVFVKNEELHNHTQVRPMLKVGSKLDFIITEFNDEKEMISLSNQVFVEKESEIFESAIQ